MSDTSIVEQVIEDTTDGEVPAARAEAESDGPSYKMIGKNRIPVSKRLGTLWKSRIDEAMTRDKTKNEAWQEAFAYYSMSQEGHRDSDTTGTVGYRAGNRSAARTVSGQVSYTENIVFSNITSTVPAIYAKNPDIEAIPYKKDDPGSKQFARMWDLLISTLLTRKHAPGVNFKPIAKQAVALAQLTNEAWCEIGYIQREQSTEQVQAELAEIAEKLGKATNEKEIIELEGQLMAIEDKFDVAQPAGPFTKLRSPTSVIVDPASVRPDHTDAKWIAVEDYHPTNLLYAVYGEKDKDGNWVTIFQPKYTIAEDMSAGMGIDQDAKFTLIKEVSSTEHPIGQDGKLRGLTKTITVWDRVTRRVYLFVEDQWKWPLWVWNDPYNLPGMFPFFKLSFFSSPLGGRTKGEVSFYLDQQDELNEINDTVTRARRNLKNNVLFDTNSGISVNDVQEVLRGEDGTARGISVPEGKSIKDIIFGFEHPALKHPELLAKEGIYAQIDRISGTSEVIRGGQFKTNTTNQAVQSYQASTQTRLDDKIDSLEDWIGCIAEGLGMLCVQFMDEGMVKEILGDQYVAAWQNMSPRELLGRFGMRVVGGSTVKPTSAAKKQDAVQVAQALGQFVQASPMVVLTMLQVMASAFNEISMTDEDWKKLNASVEQAITQATQQPQPGQAPPQQGQAGPQLPPEIEQQVVQIAQEAGIPVEEARNRVLAALQQQPTQ